MKNRGTIKLIDLRRVKLNEFLFFAAFIFYFAHYFINASLIDNLVPGVLRLFRLAVLFILALKWLFAERYSKKKVWVWGIFLITLLSVVVGGRYRAILLSMCLILSGQEIEFQKIVKALFLNTAGLSILIVLLCFLGILPDYTFVHELGSKVVTAHSWGFDYYSWLGFIAMALTMMWIYLRKKVRLFELIILGLLNYVLFEFHTTNLAFYITIMYMAACYCVEGLHIICFMKKFWKYFATVLPVVLCTLTFAIVFAYEKGILSVGISWMNTVVGRLEYSVEAIEKYGIRLFATRVQQFGNTAKVYGSAESAFYIDSGYVYSVIAYGIIFTVLVLVLYTILFRYLYQTNEKILYLWVATMLFSSIMNNFLYDIMNNPVLFLIPAAVFGDRTLKKQTE